MAEKFWWLAPAISGLAFLAVLWFQFGQHKLRSLRMRKPFDAFLTIDHQIADSLSYEVHLPADREVLLHLRVYPILHYTQMELVFGFVGDKARKPEILYVKNTWVVRGRSVETPEDDEDNYVDADGTYHIKRTAERAKGNCYAIGYFLRTKEPGVYPVRLEAMTDSGESMPRHGLTVTVENRRGKTAQQPSSNN